MKLSTRRIILKIGRGIMKASFLIAGYLVLVILGVRAWKWVDENFTPTEDRDYFIPSRELDFLERED